MWRVVRGPPVGPSVVSARSSPSRRCWGRCSAEQRSEGARVAGRGPTHAQTTTIRNSKHSGAHGRRACVGRAPRVKEGPYAPVRSSTPKVFDTRAEQRGQQSCPLSPYPPPPRFSHFQLTTLHASGPVCPTGLYVLSIPDVRMQTPLTGSMLRCSFYRALRSSSEFMSRCLTACPLRSSSEFVSRCLTACPLRSSSEFVSRCLTICPLRSCESPGTNWMTWFHPNELKYSYFITGIQ